MISLKGQFLVAMPSMGDERFRETVIYLVGHGEEDHVPAQLRAIAGDVEQRGELGDAQTLVVEGAASEEPPVDHLAAERRLLPARAGGHYIHVMHEDEGRPIDAWAGSQARVQAGAPTRAD